MSAACKLATLLGEAESAHELLDEAGALAQTLGAADVLAELAFDSSMLTWFEGDFGRALVEAERAARQHLAVDNPALACEALLTASVVAFELKDPRSSEICRSLLALTEKLGSHLMRAAAHWVTGLGCWLNGDPDGAVNHLRTSIILFRLFDRPYLTAMGLGGLAWVAVDGGDFQRAARLLGAAHRIWLTSSTPLPRDVSQRITEKAEAEARNEMGERAFEEAFRQGSELSHDAALNYAVGDQAGTPKEQAADNQVSELTRREQEVARLVGDGLTNKEIAERLVISWRTAEAHVEHILTKLGFHTRSQGQKDINVIGFCAGGILATIALNHLAARGEKSVRSASYAVTMLDFGGRNPINTFAYAPVLSLAGWNSRRKGIIDARAMGSAFTWMRPNDLVWNYWINNYLMGLDPPIFDILAWNADGTNIPARLHGQFIDIFRSNPLTRPGARRYLDTPLDLGSIELPKFVVGALNDHLTPWRGTYRSAQLMGGETTYVLSNAGHIASLVNPPGNPKASYFTGPSAGEVDADAWHAGAVRQTGSWWEAWADWTTEHAGAEVAAPDKLGLADSQPVAAPGLYVRDQLP